MKKLLIILLITSPSAIMAEEEHLLFRENLINIIKNDNFVKCTSKEVEKYGVTEERCIQVKNDAVRHCAKLVNELEPNKVTHTQWEKRMGYFWHCRILVTSGCNYTFEITDLVRRMSKVPKEEIDPLDIKRLEKSLVCHGMQL